MPILYSVISRETTVLVENDECAVHFTEVTERIIKNIPSHDHKAVYSHDDYLVHFMNEDRIIYMCITDDKFEQSRAFLFLSEIKRRFISQYGLQVATAISYAMNTDFSPILAHEMKQFSESNDVDAISKVKGEIDEVKSIMVQNIEGILERGDNLKLLADKAEQICDSSKTFQKVSKSLARDRYWKNHRMYVVIIVLVPILIYVIVSMACGGFLWQKCLNEEKKE